MASAVRDAYDASSRQLLQALLLLADSDAAVYGVPKEELVGRAVGGVKPAVLKCFIEQRKGSTVQINTKEGLIARCGKHFHPDEARRIEAEESEAMKQDGRDGQLAEQGEAEAASAEGDEDVDVDDGDGDWEPPGGAEAHGAPPRRRQGPARASRAGGVPAPSTPSDDGDDGGGVEVTAHLDVEEVERRKLAEAEKNGEVIDLCGDDAALQAPQGGAKRKRRQEDTIETIVLDDNSEEEEDQVAGTKKSQAKGKAKAGIGTPKKPKRKKRTLEERRAQKRGSNAFNVWKMESLEEYLTQTDAQTMGRDLGRYQIVALCEQEEQRRQERLEAVARDRAAIAERSGASGASSLTVLSWNSTHCLPKSGYWGFEWGHTEWLKLPAHLCAMQQLGIDPPDVLLLQEFDISGFKNEKDTARQLKLAKEHLLSYHYRLVAAKGTNGEPNLSDCVAYVREGGPFEHCTAELLDPEGGKIFVLRAPGVGTLVNVHLPTPNTKKDGARAALRKKLDGVLAEFCQREAADLLAVMGDFNVTPADRDSGSGKVFRDPSSSKSDYDGTLQRHKDLVSNCGLVDLWRHLFPNEQSGAVWGYQEKHGRGYTSFQMGRGLGRKHVAPPGRIDLVLVPRERAASSTVRLLDERGLFTSDEVSCSQKCRKVLRADHLSLVTKLQLR